MSSSTTIATLFCRSRLADRLVMAGLARINFRGLLCLTARDFWGQPVGEFRTLAREPDGYVLDLPDPANDAHFSLGAVPYDAPEIHVVDDPLNAAEHFRKLSEADRKRVCVLASRPAAREFAVEFFLYKNKARVRYYQRVPSLFRERIENTLRWLPGKALGWVLDQIDQHAGLNFGEVAEADFGLENPRRVR